MPFIPCFPISSFEFEFSVSIKGCVSHLFASLPQEIIVMLKFSPKHSGSETTGKGE